jgi:Adenylate kinase and related kinases
MKIIILGCPGAGKSTLTRRINEFFHYPVMHLDKVYHTKGKDHITREELILKVKEFANKYDDWIIDGNYISTIEMRVKLADTIILLNIPSDTCLINVYSRAEESFKERRNRDDMAEDFDETITDEFINFIKNFQNDTMPKIKNILNNFLDKKVYVISNYIELEEFLDCFIKEEN